MLEFVAETVASPLTAAGRPVGQGRPIAAAPMLVLALGSVASSIAGWLSGAGLPGESRATLAVVGGRFLIDLGVWLVVAALLGLFERLPAGAGAGMGTGSGDTAGSSPPPWTVPLAVVGAQRLYLLPAAAIARLFRLAYALKMVRIAVWMWMAALLWLLAQQRGLSGPQATKLLLLALGLPAALILAGLGLAGLGWLWSPLFPGGITPFPPL